MSRPTVLSYALVSKICLAFIAAGETPTVKKIQQQSGGSFSTVGKFYQQWQQEQGLAAKTEAELSEPFRQAILAEFARVTEKVQATLNAQLTDTRAQLKEAQDIMADYESKVEQLNQALADDRASFEAIRLKLEKDLSATQARLEESAKREAACTAQFEDLRQKCHESELRTATSEVKLAEIQKYQARLELDLRTLQERPERQQK